MSRQRLDHIEQLGDLRQRGLNLAGALPQPLDRAGRKQPRLVAGFGDPALVFLELVDGTLQLEMLGAQHARGIDHRLDDAGYVGATDGDLPASLGNRIERGRPASIQCRAVHDERNPP